MKNASETLSVAKGEVGERVSTKLQVLFKKKLWVFNIYHCLSSTVLNEDDVFAPENITPEKIPLLKYEPVTSCDAESNFFSLKTY